MNNSSGAVVRTDLNTFVEEASRVDELFIANKVFPEYPVEVKDGTYPKFTLAGGAELLDGDISERAPKGSYKRVQRTFTMDSYSTKDRGLEELVDDEEKRDNARFFDQEVSAAKFVLRRMKIAYEIRVAAALFDNTAFNATDALVAYTPANLAAGTIDPVGDILGATDRLAGRGVVGSTMVLSHYLYTRMRRSKILQDYIRGNRPSDSIINISPQMIADAFDLEQCLVAKVPKNAAKKGKATVATPIWSPAFFWIGDVQEGDPHNGGAGRTLVWNAEGGLFVTETYRADTNRSDVIRVRQHSAEKVIDPTAGELITTNWAA